MQVSTQSTPSNYINGVKCPDERDDIQVYCADIVRWHRKRQGLSVQELADKAGVSRMFIIRAEKYNWQSLIKMFAVLRALGIKVKGIEFAPIQELEKK